MQILSYKLDAFIPFDKDSIEDFLVLCEDVICKMTSDEKAIFKLKSATHELLINSLEHGYNRNAGTVSFYMKRHPDKITLEMTDEGSGFDTSLLKSENLGTDLNSIKGRGWGLMIIKRLSDSMEITPNTPKGTKINISISLNDLWK
ncbi:ATP-binding protein [Acetivibrio cellulolyticus]|uniref:ATP-binding protein n=1 Tax=Acetivibrio cellulolyticus TaxID=35830 RepID=UPI0001E2D0A1|nr:ATP-binding protein [Acetivibrio cellulolyticus]